jgi:hypothetical protein
VRESGPSPAGSREVIDGARASAALRAEIAAAEAAFAAHAAPIRLLFIIGGLGPGGAERQAVRLLEADGVGCVPLLRQVQHRRSE